MNQHIKISVGQKWIHPMWGSKVFVISRIDNGFAYHISSVFNKERALVKLSEGLSPGWVCLNESTNDGLINQE